MLVFSIITMLVLLLMYLVFRIQTLNKEIYANRSLARQHADKASTAYKTLNATAKTLQKICLDRVEQANKKGLLSGKQYELMMAISGALHQVIFDCCEKAHTVEEALTLFLRETEISMDDVKSLLQEQPNDVRMSWVQNTPESFIKACNLMTLSLMAPRSAPSPQE